MKRATIRDVARRARVSHQTVSRVINGRESVTTETRDRVLRAIRELDYVPSAVARSLTSNRTHTLGMVTTDVSDHFFAEAVAGAEGEARKRGYFLIIGSIEEGSEDDERTYLRLMLERRVEGLIVAVPRLRLSDDDLLGQAAQRIPTVLVASDVDLPGADHVDIDNRRGGGDATEHLIAHGHRAIGTITGPLDWPSARARLDGYRDAMRRAGLAADRKMVEPCVDWGLESGQRAAQRLLSQTPRVTAIFAQSDLLALGAIAALRAAGLRIPEDVSVIGFDDIPVASVFDPPLTTLRQPMRAVGELAAQLVTDHQGAGRRRGRLARRHVLRAPLVVRKSVATRKGAGPSAGALSLAARRSSVPTSSRARAASPASSGARLRRHPSSRCLPSSPSPRAALPSSPSLASVASFVRHGSTQACALRAAPGGAVVMPREDPSRAMPGRRGAERRLAHMSGRWAVRQANAADATLPRCDPCRPSHVLFGAFVAEATAGVWTLAASCARLQAMSEDRGVGVTHVQGVVTGPTRKQAEVRFLVDSGAMYSLLPYEVWREIELSPRRVQAFGLADGTRIERAVSGCHIRLPQGETDTTVILGEPSDVALLGVVTLEELGLVLNPFDRTLHPMEHLLLRIGAERRSSGDRSSHAA